uniref:Uncharacterized protein n=1 Tax=Saimiri boliviensis boliviensis TaxID=39432 RepID=A0A2K6TM04_SAIBB
MESPNPQGIPNLKIQSQALRKPNHEVLVPGIEETAVRISIPGSQVPQALFTGIPIAGNWRTSMP